jgi:thioredoxin 1
MLKYLSIGPIRAAGPVLAALAVAVLLMRPALADPLYPNPASARSDIDAALAQAAGAHKRVLIDFGANWCTDCKVLEQNFRKPENAALLATHFVLVRVNVGDSGIDHNVDLAQGYGVPLKKGVPALAVLEGDGRVVFSQTQGEFEAMRTMDPKSVNDFLTQWKRPSP